MKHRIIVASAILALSATAVPATATAETATKATVPVVPIDPQAALKAQFVAGHGVKVLESGKTSSGRDLLTSEKRRGVMQFGPSGVTGYDIQAGSDLRGETAKPVRSLAVDGHLYLSGGMAGALPDGKKWTGTPARISALSPFLTRVLVLEPGTLNTLLATNTVKTANTSVYQGTVTFGMLYRVSPSYRASFGKRRISTTVAATKVNWRLWVGRDKLPVRLVTSWIEPPASMRVTRVSDVRFASWGTPVTLTPPPVEETLE